MTTAINIHPVDELAAVREEIKQLQEREAHLKASLMSASDEDREGRNYRAYIALSKRESVDKDAIIAALGRAVVEPYIKSTDVKSLKLAPKEPEKL